MDEAAWRTATDEAVWHFAIAVLWVGWLLYWIANASKVKPTRWREPAGSQIFHRIPLVIAALLLFTGHARSGLLTGHFLPQAPVVAALGTLMVAAGIALAVWARRCLGSNWSSVVTLKEDHDLIRSGPYASVRHPIYSGILLAIAGTAIVYGEWRDLLALGLAVAGLIYKAHVEEGRMAATFSDYDGYRKATAALVPFVY